MSNFFKALYQWYVSQIPPDACVVKRACGHLEAMPYSKAVPAGIESMYETMGKKCKECSHEA